MGWQRDLPDPRDYSARDQTIARHLRTLPSYPYRSLPPSIDLRDDDYGECFGTAADQKNENSSTAHACLSLLEYFYRKSLGQKFEGSPGFLYEISQILCNKGPDEGVSIRETFKALRRYGAPPKELWHRASNCKSPLNHIGLTGFSKDFNSFQYFRLDTHMVDTVDELRAFLAAGIPVVLGFPVPRSLTEYGVVPFCGARETYRGGQAVLVVGYDDSPNYYEDGSFLFRNSWGINWGESGYGWLPYPCLRRRVAVDLWTGFDPIWFGGGETNGENEGEQWYYCPSVIGSGSDRDYDNFPSERSLK